MEQLLLGALSLLFHLYFFLAFGSLFLKIQKGKKFSWCFVPVLGFFIYYSVFEVLALPMTLLLVPLHVLTFTWAFILAAVGVAAAFLCGKSWVIQGQRMIGILLRQKGIFLLLLLLTAAQMIYAAIYNLNSADAAFYVGNVSTSLYTDTLGRYNPYTGAAMSKFNVRYVTAAYYLDSAVFCSIFKVHPMVLTKTITPVMVMFLVNLLYYHLGMELFGGFRKKALGFSALVLFFGVMAGNTALSGFLFYRTFEGKAILSGLVIPFLFLSFFKLYAAQEDKLAWWSLFFTALGGICLSTSSMTVVPAGILAGVVALMILKKKWKPLIPAFFCVLPDVAVMVLYVGVKMHLFSLVAK